MPRPWNEIDWSQPRPSVSELISSWPRLRWEPRTPESPALGAYLAEVARTHANGGYLLGQWRAVEYSDVAQWFISRNRLDEYELFRLLFTSDIVRRTLPDLAVPATLGSDVGGLQQHAAGALVLDGLWAHLITGGGAYHRFAGTAREAKTLAAAAVDALVGGRFEDFRVDITHDAWTPWFHDVAWDSTYVLTDLRNAQITVLCITDTD